MREIPFEKENLQIFENETEIYKGDFEKKMACLTAMEMMNDCLDYIYQLLHPMYPKVYKPRIYLADKNKQKIWNEYFNMLWQQRTRHKTFKSVLEELCELTDEVHASYASKLVATVDENKPVIDSHVKKVLGIHEAYVYWTNDKKIRYWDDVYSKIVKKYKELSDLIAEDKVTIETLFNSVWPELQGMTLTKKIDHLIWEIGKQRNSKK